MIVVNEGVQNVHHCLVGCTVAPASLTVALRWRSAQLERLSIDEVVVTLVVTGLNKGWLDVNIDRRHCGRVHLHRDMVEDLLHGKLFPWQLTAALLNGWGRAALHDLGEVRTAVVAVQLENVANYAWVKVVDVMRVYITTAALTGDERT